MNGFMPWLLFCGCGGCGGKCSDGKCRHSFGCGGIFPLLWLWSCGGFGGGRCSCGCSCGENCRCKR